MHEHRSPGIAPTPLHDLQGRARPRPALAHHRETTRLLRTSLSVVASPNPKPNASNFLSGIAAGSANDIWAVGYPAIQNWNGTSWSIVTNPVPDFRTLTGMTALSDGTVAAVGDGTNSSGMTIGLILEN
jgi:hypothetical protein